MNHNEILQIVIAQNLQFAAMFFTGLITTPLVVYTGTKLCLEWRKYHTRKAARAFLRTAKPDKVNNMGKWLKGAGFEDPEH